MDDTEQLSEQYSLFDHHHESVHEPSVQHVVQDELIHDTIMESSAAADESVIQEAQTMTMRAQHLFDQLDLASAGEKLMNGNALAVGMFSLTVAILSFFFYKLVSSISNRQKAKDAKKKQKQKDSPKSAAANKKKV